VALESRPCETTFFHIDFRGCKDDESVVGSTQLPTEGFLTFLEYDRIVSVVKLEDNNIVSGKHAIETRSVSITSGGRGTALTKSSTGIWGMQGGFESFSQDSTVGNGEGGGVCSM
jgi:hypothetical protein